MAGELAHALRPTGYLQNTKQAFRDYIAEIENRERKKKLLSLILNAGNQIKQGYEPTDVQNPDYLSALNNQSTDPFLSENPMRKEAGLNVLSKTPQTIKQVDFNAGDKNAKNVLGNLLLNSVGSDVDPQELSKGIEGLKMLVPDKPKPPEGFNLSEGEQRFEIDPTTKKLRLVAENTKDIKPDDKIKNATDKGYWDFSDPKNPKYVANPNYKKEVSSSESLAWMKYNDEKKKDDEELNKEQAKYNNIMASPFVSMDELVAQGLIDEAIPNYGGAFLVTEDNGQTNLIYDKRVLENYAKTKVPDAPNKWTRKDDKDTGTDDKKKTDKKKETKGKKTESKYVEGKVYIDAKGNKAIYKNGKFEEIK